MGGKIVDERDVQFILWEHLDVPKYFKHPIFKGYGKDEFNMIMEEARKFAETAIYPVNFIGDEEGVKIENGQVKAPPCYRPVYDALVEGGWTGLAAAEEYGGQDLPEIIGIAVTEKIMSASIAFSMYPGLTRAACALIEECCTPEQKKKYMPNMVAGKWQGTMCLTEPSAGSAVGDLKSTAKKRPDGQYEISGNKIFISSGDHDMCENMIHLVLARAEGSPAGIKGISLFLAPKYLVKDDGSLGAYNNVRCPKVEHKMGIHGSSTAELLFGEEGPCVGELVGELNHGIESMFVMMNEARIGTGMQGLAAASAAYLHSLQYTKERIQGVAIENMRDVNAPRVEIIKHPDVRRMLLSQKSMVEGMRALLYRGVMYGTIEKIAEKPEEREAAADALALLTPMIKAYCSDQGFLSIREAIQCFGGYGYCTEYKVDQYMRDSKIASIYEGTNAIQALDLIGRKVLNIKKKMKPYNDYVAMMKTFTEANKGHAKYGKFIAKLGVAIDNLDATTKFIAGKGMLGDTAYPVMYATPYLEGFGHVIVAHLLAEQLIIADRKLEEIFKGKGAADDKAKAKVIEEIDEAAFYQGKIYSATFFIDFHLPKSDSIWATIKSENRDMLTISERCF
jgi:alkylation response protein AidB-like acyl-CoA dehydrogenase